LYLGAGVGETGFLNFAQPLPFLLFAISAGVLADRFSRVRVMLWAEAIRVCALLCVLALAAPGLLTWPLLRVVPPMHASNSRARWPSSPGLPPRVSWSAGAARRPHSALPVGTTRCISSRFPSASA